MGGRAQWVLNLLISLADTGLKQSEDCPARRCFMLAGIFLLVTAAALPNPGNPLNPGMPSSSSPSIHREHWQRENKGLYASVRKSMKRGTSSTARLSRAAVMRRLDNETCDLIIDHASFRLTLDSEGKARAAVHDGVVNWRIPGAPAPATAPVKAASASGRSPDEVVCRRITRTGSLVAHSRLCLTPRQWVNIRNRTRTGGGDPRQIRQFSRRSGHFSSDLATPGHLSGRV
jgi:hypothetical protein